MNPNWASNIERRVVVLTEDLAKLTESLHLAHEAMAKMIESITQLEADAEAHEDTLEKLETRISRQRP